MDIVSRISRWLDLSLKLFVLASVFGILVSQGLTENQNRLLYMVSLYTHKADTRGDRDHWLRKPALVVLLYEGIVANVLDFDYAPQSELIENRRIWMNVSQVG